MGDKHCIQACDYCKLRRRRCIKMGLKCQHCIDEAKECTYFKKNNKRGRTGSRFKAKIHELENGHSTDGENRFVNFDVSNIHLLYEQDEGFEDTNVSKEFITPTIASNVTLPIDVVLYSSPLSAPQVASNVFPLCDHFSYYMDGYSLEYSNVNFCAVPPSYGSYWS
ncbi:hypothetical protein K502DRAFT_350119 [Neoconidiobolus thromboides FSU 785]|nr:hypothetical protein K502DRAFT_350119 [Neoconidiobolus thromboides FSU 785]